MLRYSDNNQFNFFYLFLFDENINKYYNKKIVLSIDMLIDNTATATLNF